MQTKKISQAPASCANWVSWFIFSNGLLCTLIGRVLDDLRVPMVVHCPGKTSARIETPHYKTGSQ